jgi:predicted DCC family thiol-disulfide oxidoreductase YuxK
MHEHLIIFDAECPFCHKAVREVIAIDLDHQFLFAPLGGKTSVDVLTGPQLPLTHANSLVLVEHYRSTQRRYWIRSRAVFRIYWIIGRQWSLFGLLSFLPCWIGDWLYRSFAAHRHQFKLKMPKDPGPKDRFLP